MLVRVEQGTATVRPTAGTRRRTGDADEDRRLAADLLQDSKELAEHDMLVTVEEGVLSQEELLEQMMAEAFVYGEYRTFQVPVTEIEEKTRLGFGELRDHDPKHTLAEAAPARRVELADFSEIVL